MQASWVISKITGNYNNTSSFGNSAEYDEPNFDPALQPNREGKLTNDNTHIAKLFGTYRGPWDILMSGRVLLHLRPALHPHGPRSGCRKATRTSSPNRAAASTFEAQKRLDIRLEKQFRVGGRPPTGAHVRRFQPDERCGDHRPQHPFVGDVLLPAHEPPGSAALPHRRDLPLLADARSPSLRGRASLLIASGSPIQAIFRSESWIRHSRRIRDSGSGTAMCLR